MVIKLDKRNFFTWSTTSPPLNKNFCDNSDARSVAVVNLLVQMS